MIPGSRISRDHLSQYISTKKKRSLKSPYYALLDSGADNVLMPAELAEQIGIEDITYGKPETVMGIAGQRAEVYLFDLEVEIVGDARRLPTTIGFSTKIFIPILGRSLFRHFKTVSFNETEEELELKI